MLPAHESIKFKIINTTTISTPSLTQPTKRNLTHEINTANRFNYQYAVYHSQHAPIFLIYQITNALITMK